LFSSYAALLVSLRRQMLKDAIILALVCVIVALIYGQHNTTTTTTTTTTATTTTRSSPTSSSSCPVCVYSQLEQRPKEANLAFVPSLHQKSRELEQTWLVVRHNEVCLLVYICFVCFLICFICDLFNFIITLLLLYFYISFV
jgi:hypothetical protein